MSDSLLLALYCLPIIAASLLGGRLAMTRWFTHRRLQLALSVIAGFILGVAVLHLLVHALHTLKPMAASLWLLAGLLTVFLLERFAPFHHHEVAEHPHQHDHDDPHNPPAPHDQNASAHHACGSHVHGPGAAVSWPAACVGLVVHSVFAGIALAAAVHSSPDAWWPGLSVLLVIVAHKPLDALTLIALAGRDARSRSRRQLINLLFALAVPLGIVMFEVLFAIRQPSPWADSQTLVAATLAFCAGLFLHIALSDLLPELHAHHHDRLALSAAMMVGLVLAGLLALLEAPHDHRDPAHRDATHETAESQGDTPHDASHDHDHDHDHAH